MLKNIFEIRMKQMLHVLDMCNAVINNVVQHDESQFSMLFGEWVRECVSDSIKCQ